MADRSRPKGKIIVFGILFWYPLAGVTYQFLHYLIGLRRLGYDPYYVEDSARWIYDPHLNDLSPDADGNIAAVVPALQAHGFGDRWAFRGKYPGGKCYGLSESQIEQLYREADGFLNVTGAQELREEHLAIKRRIYVESDPFALQVKVAKGDTGAIKMLEAYDVLFSFGENLGAQDCAVPVDKFRWLPTRQPVVMDLWNGHQLGGDSFTTITTWHNKGKNIEWQDQTWYWTKDREFQKFLNLPARRPEKFELAATVDDEAKSLLNNHGWRQTSSLEISRDTERYRNYILQSRGEFTVARDQYARGKTGWFSDRSACYLAAGRPVITQETGFMKNYASKAGLLSFRTLDEIADAVKAINGDYAKHSRTARAIAREVFEAEKVLKSILDRAGI